ncbi:MAG: LysR family transcriptional regulator [Clostridia bacterium]|nr:LysR family transcriptional regulator [Clostridia bacterium]
MDERDYVYEVYKERSFSAAAKNLFVSQPALSTSVKKTERALGITIFDRSTSPITLTEEGKLYIESLEEIRHIESRTRERLADLSDLRTGKITVSGENFVSSFILPPILMRFAEKYAGISVELVESNSPELRRELLTETIDLLIAHDFDPVAHTAVPLFDEALLLAVPQSFAINGRLSPFALSLSDVQAGRHLSSDCPAVDLRAFADESFLLLKKGNDMQRRAHELCEAAGFTPRTGIRLDQLITSYNLACAGMGVTFTSDKLVERAGGQNCVYYRLSGEHAVRRMYIGHKRNRYVSRACAAFIETAKEVYAEK